MVLKQCCPCAVLARHAVGVRPQQHVHQARHARCRAATLPGGRPHRGTQLSVHKLGLAAAEGVCRLAPQQQEAHLWRQHLQRATQGRLRVDPPAGRAGLPRQEVKEARQAAHQASACIVCGRGSRQGPRPRLRAPQVGDAEGQAVQPVLFAVHRQRLAAGARRGRGAS